MMSCLLKQLAVEICSTFYSVVAPPAIERVKKLEFTAPLKVNEKDTASDYEAVSMSS